MPISDLPAYKQLQKLGSGIQSQVVNLGALPWAQVWYPTAVVVDAGGTITGQLQADTVDKTYPVSAGQNNMSFKSITSVSGPASVVMLQGS